VKRIVYILVFALLVPKAFAATSPTAQELKLATGTELTLQVWSGDKRSPRVLWLGSDAAFPSGMLDVAHALNAKGIEIVQVDMLSAHFLPALPSSLEQVPDSDLGALLQQVMAIDNRPLLLMADGLGAKLLVRAAQAWRIQTTQSWPKTIAGVILLSPNLYVATPAAGAEAEYIAQSGALGGRIIVLQPQLSPLYWWLERLQQMLVQSSATVEITPLPGVRDRFYFRPDASPKEQQLAKQLPDMILKNLEKIEEHTK